MATFSFFRHYVTYRGKGYPRFHSCDFRLGKSSFGFFVFPAKEKVFSSLMRIPWGIFRN